MNGSLQLLIFQFIIFLILLFIVFYLIKFNRSIKLEKRIGKYAIDSINAKSIAFFDVIYNVYKVILKWTTKLLLKIKIFDKYSDKYRKYIDYTDKNSIIAMDFIANKILVSISILLINFIANIIKYRYPSIIEILLAILIGFFVPDLLVRYQDYVKRKNVEKEMLNAIIIMNNAFKSGRSTMQAIEIVRDELEGPIKEEFRKMHTEIAYGLSLEVVFKRFSERVNLEEAKYITSSLTILNKTGGNIVKVFSSIERSLFSKRKLEIELKSLTASSKALSKALLVMPFIFVGIILIINPTYFNSLFNTDLGLIVFACIVLFYIMYAFFVRRVMKVRM